MGRRSEMGALRTDFDMLKITIDATEYPGSVDHVYTQTYISHEYVEDATFFDVMEIVTKEVEKVLRKRLVTTCK